MPETKSKEPSKDTYKTQVASLSLKTAMQTETIKRLRKERDAFKEQNMQLASVIESDLKADLIIRIQAASKYSQEELGNMTVTQLKNVEETLAKTEGYASAQYKSIRAGSASFDHTSRLTVGDLYNKGGKT